MKRPGRVALRQAHCERVSVSEMSRSLRDLKPERQTRVRDRAVERLVREPLLHVFPERDQLLDIDARFEAHRFEHEYEVFGADVAARAGRIRTAAEPTERRIERTHAG